MKPSLLRSFRLLFLPVLGAAALSGNCTAIAQGEVADWVPFAAAALAGGLALVFGVLLWFAGLRPDFSIWSTVTASASIGMLLAVLMVASSNSLGVFFVPLTLSSLAAGVLSGYPIGNKLGSGRGLAVAILAALAVLGGQGLLFLAYFLSADVCIAIMGNTCDNLDPIKWVRFGAMVAMFPSAVAVVPALAAAFLARGAGKA